MLDSRILELEDKMERLVSQGFHVASAKNNMEILLNFCHIARYENNKMIAQKNKGVSQYPLLMNRKQRFAYLKSLTKDQKLQLIYGSKK
tara:strand:+ start:796 stop:1062 length:267 start_codon:yes stop_codon:yes gene_type:complete